jgi:hypothetical protein
METPISTSVSPTMMGSPRKAIVSCAVAAGRQGCQNKKLITALPDDQRRTELLLEAIRNGDEDLIAGRVAEQIIHTLEAIQV